MDNTSLQALLGANVLELDFVRRHPKLGWSDVRGLFGTTNYDVLNGPFGRQVLNFIPPKGVGMGYDYKSYNLCVVWDIFRQEYRVFGAEQVNIHKQWDVTTEEGRKEFEQYFYDYIINMTEDSKLKFMGFTNQYNIVNAPPIKRVEPNIPTQQEVQKRHIKNSVSKVFAPLLSRIKNYFKRKEKN